MRISINLKLSLDGQGVMDSMWVKSVYSKSLAETRRLHFYRLAMVELEGGVDDIFGSWDQVC